MAPFLKPAALLSIVLVAQAALFYAVPRAEHRVAAPALSEVPQQVNGWRMLREQPMDAATESSVHADNYLSRDYVNAQGQLVSLFVAFFRSQRTGQAPHSPKNCLPAAGWIWTATDIAGLRLPGQNLPVVINRYAVSKADQKAVVLYWYQSRDRVVADELRAAAFTAWDALRWNRTDTALIRVVAPVVANREDQATDAGLDFVRSIFAPLRHTLPD